MKNIIGIIGICLIGVIIVSMVAYLYIQDSRYNKLCENELKDGSLILKDGNILFCENDVEGIPVKFVCKDFWKLDCTMKHLEYKLGV